MPPLTIALKANPLKKESLWRMPGQGLVHFHIAGSESTSIVVELNIGMVSQK